MNDNDSFWYAKQRLVLAEMMNDADEIKNWQQHILYWESRLTPLAPDAAGSGSDEEQGRAAAQVKHGR
jgi:hypothetical protein